MGWNIACALIANKENYFSEFPSHSHRKASDLATKLDYGPIRQSSISNLAQGLDPKPGYYSIGAYDCGAVVAGVDFLYGFAENPNDNALNRIQSIYSDSNLLFINLSSATNYFSYALYENYKQKRVIAGDASRGIFLNKGELHDKEKNLFSKHVVVNGEKKFILNNNGKEALYSELEMGEVLSFEMASIMLGVSLNVYPSENLEIEIFKDSRPWRPLNFVKKLFG